MQSIWKKVVIIMLAIFLLLHLKHIISVLEECRLGDLFVDTVNYLWTVPQGLRFAMLSAFFIMLFVFAFKILMRWKGGDGKWRE